MRLRAIIWAALVALGVTVVAMACGGQTAREEEPPLVAEDGCVAPSAKCLAEIPQFKGVRLTQEESMLCDRIADLAARIRNLEPERARL